MECDSADFDSDIVNNVICMDIHVHIHAHVCTHMHAHVFARVRMHTCTCTRTHIYYAPQTSEYRFYAYLYNSPVWIRNCYACNIMSRTPQKESKCEY